MTEQKTYTINNEQKGERLDVFLSSRLDKSRSLLQKEIAKGSILVNKQIIKKNYILKKNDHISFANTDVLSKTQSINLPKVTIVLENEHFIIVNKPSGIVVHPDSAHPEGTTLIDTLVSKYPELKKVGEDEGRPGVIHRLDKPVSGVMVIARTQEMYKHLKQQFQNRTIIKKYFALVHGNIESDHNEITYNIARKKNGYMAAKTDSKEGRSAHTEIDVIKRYPNSTLLDVSLKTGRTHQIRVHLLAYGNPIVGDTVYMSKKYKEHKLNTKISRLFLHSHYLQFIDLMNTKQTFEEPLETELQDLVSELDKKHGL